MGRSRARRVSERAWGERRAPRPALRAPRHEARAASNLLFSLHPNRSRAARQGGERPGHGPWVAWCTRARERVVFWGEGIVGLLRAPSISVRS